MFQSPSNRQSNPRQRLQILWFIRYASTVDNMFCVLAKRAVSPMRYNYISPIVVIRTSKTVDRQLYYIHKRLALGADGVNHQTTLCFYISWYDPWRHSHALLVNPGGAKTRFSALFPTLVRNQHHPIR